MHEIFKGKSEVGYYGLFPLFDEFMKVKNFPMDKQMEIKIYLDFLMARAKGEVKTDARFIREFVMNHPKYEKDSVVSDPIMYDLLKTIDSMSRDDYSLNLFSTKSKKQ
jgi:glutamate--cysteine ligase catalytic subunit